MTNLSITRAKATTKEAVGIAIPDLYKHRIENPYMYTGDVRRVRLRVDSEQFTQIVDWFSDNFEVIGQDADQDAYYDIELKVNLDSFIYWVLQYSGCVEVLETSKRGKNNSDEESFRERVKKTLKDALKKYKED